MEGQGLLLLHLVLHGKRSKVPLLCFEHGHILTVNGGNRSRIFKATGNYEHTAKDVQYPVCEQEDKRTYSSWDPLLLDSQM